MNIKSLKLGSSYSFRKPLHGEVSLVTIFESLTPGSGQEGTESVLEDILRWADDGGKMLDLAPLLSRVNPDTVRERQKE